jgi:hypothetical protein
LFKSFTSTLKKADPSIIILPFRVSKQHYSSISTVKQIQAIDDNKISQFFKSYHQKQLYSLSGFFHISSQLSFNDLYKHPIIEEWLDSYHYFMRLCPSQNEEMVQIGALCYGSIFLFREDLKQAILAHPQWTPTDPMSSLIFDIYVRDFKTPGKKTKMLFLSAERSKQNEVSSLLKSIYDGTKKSYQNGAMMLFLTLSEISTSSSDLRKKIVFNHEKFLEEETLFCIGGFHKLNSSILLKNGQTVTLRTLLKSIPASNGMSRPQLFQQAEPNHEAMVTIVTFQAQDRELFLARIRQVIAEGESEKVFIDDNEGIWFGGVNKQKSCHTNIIPKHTNRASMEYVSHINRIMNSPPKKRVHTPSTVKWGGGIPTSSCTSSPNHSVTQNIATPSNEFVHSLQNFV